MPSASMASRLILLAATTLASVATAVSTPGCTADPSSRTAHSAAAEPLARDPQISELVTAVSTERIERRIRTLAAFGTRHTMSDTESDRRGIGAARRWIERELRSCSAGSGGALQVALDEHTLPPSSRISRPTQLINVVATLPGTDPVSRERLLVVSGHYDSRASDALDAASEAPGADDDASGTAVAMELACVMSARRWPATLVFMAVAGEEQGLLGAERWAEQARSRGLRVDGMITNDIVGSPVGESGQRDAKQLRLFAEGLTPQLSLVSSAASAPEGSDEGRARERARQQLDAQLRAGGAADFPTDDLGRHLKAAGERYVDGFRVTLVHRSDRYLRGGDHLPFLRRGYAAVRFTEPFENFAHQHQDVRVEGGVRYGDLPEFVDYGFVADVARINLAGLATLALAPAAPRNARIETSQLTNDTTLSWGADDDPAIVGYRIVWRETGSSAWQHRFDVGRVLRATLPVSKDNVVFGVQALGARGHPSLASFPLPAGR